MERAIGIALSAAVVAAGVGSGCGKAPGEPAARECLAIWENILPEGAQLAGFEAVGRELRVRYRHREGSGEVLCDTREDGSLDDTATLNRKADFLWDHPEIAPRL